MPGPTPCEPAREATRLLLHRSPIKEGVIWGPFRWICPTVVLARLLNGNLVKEGSHLGALIGAFFKEGAISMDLS